MTVSVKELQNLIDLRLSPLPDLIYYTEYLNASKGTVYVLKF